MNWKNKKKQYIMHTKGIKDTYVSPAISRQVTLTSSGSILSGSILNEMEVTSTGQEVVDKDFDTDGFTHTWN